MAAVRAVGEVGNAERGDKSKAEDGEADEDVFRQRVANHLAGVLEDVGGRWESFIGGEMWLILSSWSSGLESRS